MTELGPDEAVSAAESEDDTEELLQFPIGFLIGVTIIYIFLCAYVFLLWEETWNYGLSLYFVLISFTTIGFGASSSFTSNRGGIWAWFDVPLKETTPNKVINIERIPSV